MEPVGCVFAGCTATPSTAFRSTERGVVYACERHARRLRRYQRRAAAIAEPETRAIPKELR